MKDFFKLNSLDAVEDMNQTKSLKIHVMMQYLAFVYLEI